MRFQVSPGGPLSGTVPVPGDKSISHRALLLAALAGGRSEVRGLSDGEDVARTAGALAELGCRFEVVERAPGSVSWAVEGGPRRLHEPARVLDMGNSGTGMRLLAGLVAGFRFFCVLTGDGSLLQRPMDRITVPLSNMGARVDGRADGAFPPLCVRGGSLKGIDYSLPVASAQVKSAILLAGLRAEGETIVREAVATRSHTEEMLAEVGAKLKVVEEGRSRVCTLSPGPIDPFSMVVARDPSQAAFWLVGACLVPGSSVSVEGLYAGRERTGFLDVLTRMGAAIEVESIPAVTSGRTGSGRTATVRARFAGRLRATDVSGEEISGLDEIPVLAVAAAVADGTSRFSGLEELRAKESDRLRTVCEMVKGLGGDAEVVDGRSLVIRGKRLSGGFVDAHGDHRIAMAAAIGALCCEDTTTIEGWESVRTSYPLFADHLRMLRWGGKGGA